MPFSFCLLLLITASHPASPAPFPPKIAIVSGSHADGTATELWLAILCRRLPAPAYDSVAVLRRVRTMEERSWASLIQSRAAHWPSESVPLARNFDSVTVERLTIVLGDRGGEDAFTHDSMTIGLDLSALQRLYGDASRPDNSERLDRFFRHEFTHLLQKRWLTRHPFTAATPLEAALLDSWAEGLGNYYSLSSRWRTGDTLSSVAIGALAELEPRFVARMTALACADSVRAVPLLADLSSGPFDQKWGALPVALWLLAETMRDSSALHTFASAGPAGVWATAERHLPEALGISLAQLRQEPRSCH